MSLCCGKFTTIGSPLKPTQKSVTTSLQKYQWFIGLFNSMIVVSRTTHKSNIDIQAYYFQHESCFDNYYDYFAFKWIQSKLGLSVCVYL